MRTLANGQRVIVKTVDSITINAAGTVTRVRTNGHSAFVELDKRSVEGVHPFPVGDSRGKSVIAEASDCEPEVKKGARGTRAQRRKNKTIVKEEAIHVTVDKFGKDHWSTFGYLAHCAIDGIGGRLDICKMRCDPARHPFLAHEGSRFGGSSPTRLKGAEELHNHDDWDCMDDLAEIGLVENIGTSVNPVVRLTPLGFDVWKQLGIHKQAGGNFAMFSPQLQPATEGAAE